MDIIKLRCCHNVSGGIVIIHLLFSGSVVNFKWSEVPRKTIGFTNDNSEF